MDIFQKYQQYLPYILLIILFLTGGLFLRVLYSYSSSIYRLRTLGRALKSPFTRPFPTSTATPIVTTSRSWFRKIYNKILSGLLYLGIMSDNEEISLSFAKAMKDLKQNFGKKKYQYKLPWFLLLGPSESGKSSVMNSAELDLPIGQPKSAIEDDRPPCQWWFFDRGVVLDLIGDYLLPKSGLQNDKSGWSRLVSLLLYHRPKRPIDGIILCIPATDLIGPNKLTHDEVVARAKQIHVKLWHIQKSLGMKIPVYALVTKTDLVPGFRGFSEELPRESLYQMFGWSSPYSLESGYQPHWVDEAFDEIRKSTHKTRAEVFSAGKVKNNRDDVLIFKVELLKLKQNLTTYLNQIFQESTYHESFFLRGIYLCGDTRTHTSVGDYKREERTWTSPDNTGSALPIPFTQDKFKVSFLRDLLEKKVFREHALARPIQRIFRSSSRLLNLTKILMGIFLLIWSIGMYRSYNRLTTGENALLPIVNEVAQTLSHIRQRDFDVNATHDAKYLNDQTLTILNLMTGINVENSFSLSIPSSWFTSYDERVRLAFTTTWDSVIFVSMYTGLTQKARSLFISLREYTNADEVNYFLPPLKTPEFLNLQEFVNETIALETHVLRFNNLENSTDIEDIGKLILYLFNKDLPAQFYTHAQYYQDALSATKDRNINLQDFGIAAKRKLDFQYQIFLNRIFDPSQNFGNFFKLSDELSALERFTSSVNINEDEFQRIVNFLIQVENFISSNMFQWIEGSEFNPGIAFSETLNKIARSRLFGTQAAYQFSQATEKNFATYKDVLTNLEVPLIGPVFSIEKGQIRAKPSTKFSSLTATFGELLTQPFMKPIKFKREISSVPPGKLLLWDTSVLKRASGLTIEFEDFIGKTIAQLSPDAQYILEYVGRQTLLVRLLNLIAQAERFQPIPHGLTGFDEEQALRLQVHNLQEAYPHFLQILGGYMIHDLSSQSAYLRELLVEETYKSLEGVNRLLIRYDLYGVSEAFFKRWNGQTMAGMESLGMHNIGDMKNYLDRQRAKIFFLANELAAPVLSFLNLPFLDAAQRNLPLTIKWGKIIQQIQAFESGSPNNSIKILENFLQYEMNLLKLDKCYQIKPGLSIPEQESDFFLDKIREVQQTMVNRCKAIAQSQGFANYNKLALFFNANLAGQFPFTQEINDINLKDADAGDVAILLSLFGQINPVEREAIQELYQAEGGRGSPIHFLKQIETLVQFLICL